LSVRRIITTRVHGQAVNFIGSLFYRSCSALEVTQEREMIEFLTEMPTNTKIFLIVAVLGLAATLIVLKWLK